MPLGLFLLFLCESAAKSKATDMTFTTSPTTTLATTTMEETMSPLQLVATPDYPVAVGQKVNLYCSAVTGQASVTWEHMKNQTWNIVSQGRNLILTKPEESGMYRCSLSSQNKSAEHTVYIIATLPTVAENLGITAFVLSLLSLIINLAILSWLCWQTLGGSFTISTTPAKDFPGPQKAPKEGFPQSQDDGSEYMNYTRTNQAYSDLDPTSMTVDNVYSSLS